MALERWMEAVDDRGGPCRRRKDAESKEKKEVSPLQLDCEKACGTEKSSSQFSWAMQQTGKSRRERYLINYEKRA